MARKATNPMYAPSKGFTKYPGVNYWKGQSLLPRELGLSSCTLANPDGISEPEGLRTIIGHWSDGTPIEEASHLLSSRHWSTFVSNLRILSGVESVISTENRLSRNAQKAAKHRVQTIVAILAKRLLKLDPSLDPLEAMSLAETKYGERLAFMDSRGKGNGARKEVPHEGQSYFQYTAPGYDSHCLRHSLQDNSKSRTISKGNGFRRIVKTA